MARKKPHEEEASAERYIVTYADLITLLLAFFIILYAMSDVNEDKVKEVALGLQIGFNTGTQELINLEMGQNPEKRETATQDEIKMMKAVSENNELREMKEKIDQKIEEEKLTQEVKTQITKDGLKIVLTDEILFASGSAELKNDFIGVIKTISVIINDVENPVQISGFTDNVPISTPRYPSNWDLSTDRALSVLRYMLTHNGDVASSRFSAAGYGEYQPIASNDTEAGKRANRRVEILIGRMNTDGLLIPDKGGADIER